MVQKLSFQQAKQMMDQDANAMLIDVREEWEYISGHAVGAILFPVGSINRNTAEQRIPAIDTPLLIYCRSGARSRKAAGTFSALGYMRVYDIGSLSGWPYGITYGAEE